MTEITTIAIHPVIPHPAFPTGSGYCRHISPAPPLPNPGLAKVAADVTR